MTRAYSNRFYRFWCWLWFNHDREMAGRTVGECARCGATLLGGD